MNKILSIIAALCFAVCVVAQEDPVIIVAPVMTVDKAAYSFTDQGITVSTGYGSAYPADHAYNKAGVNYFACLANSSITFSADKAIKGIAVNGWVKKNFSASCDNGNLLYLSDSFDDSTGEPVLTVSDINATSVTISCDNQLRCYSVEVYFSENPGAPQEEVAEIVSFTAVVAEAADYSEDPLYSKEGSYSYWLRLAPENGYPEVWLDMYAAVKGDLSGTYSLYDFNVGDYTYVQLSADELDYEYAYDQEFTITKTENGYHIEGYIIADNDVQYTFVYDGPVSIVGVETGMATTRFEPTACKVIRNGQVMWMYEGKMYDVQGRRIEN